MDNYKLSQIKIRFFIFFYFIGALPLFSQNEGKENKSLYENTGNSGFPVIGFSGDTLFYVYDRIGASTPKERASQISDKLKLIFETEQFHFDSIRIIESQNTVDLVFSDVIVTSISNEDKATYGLEKDVLADQLKRRIETSYLSAKKDQKFITNLIRGLLVLLVIGVAYFIYWLVGIFNKKALDFLERNKDKLLKNLAYKEYTFLTAEQEMTMILLIIRVLKLFLYVLLGYFSLSLAFSIFPFTRGWADRLFQLVWSPFTSIFLAIWQYLPNLFTIVVIVFVMGYFIRFVKYIFKEIDAEKLHVNGFHADWAMPTYSIVRFLLYAFMFVLIFPYLPGSDSNIFKGVSVFIGVLFSLGSSSAIANMVAGLVITYMRPFKIGDRIKIGDVTGDVMEKTLLVTRLKTPKNEEITIPNSAVLNGNTTNYSTLARTEGLIIHTTVTIGYDVPWKEVHQALIDAALRTKDIIKDPQPFVLQTGLEDFYVSYQINAYTGAYQKLAGVYSELHQHIQDSFFEKGIEILSPHYRAARDGNMTTIPTNYLPDNYQVPSFGLKMDKGNEKKI